MTTTPSRIGAVMAKPASPRPRPPPPAVSNAKAKKDLIESEQTLSKKDGAKRRRLMAAYRFAQTRQSTRGTYSERRDHLVARFEGLGGVKHHVATSSWATAVEPGHYFDHHRHMGFGRSVFGLRAWPLYGLRW